MLRGRRWRRVRRVLPVVLMLSVPALVGLLLAWILRPFTSIPAALATPMAAESHRAAAIWAASFVVFISIGMWNAIVAAAIVKRYLSRKGGRTVFGVASSCFAIGAIVRTISYGSPIAPLSVIVNAGVPIYFVTAAGTSITFFWLVLLMASCWALLYRRPGEKLSARNLRTRQAYARLSLYSAAALLIVGVVQIYFLNDWPSHVYGWTTVSMRQGLHDLAYTKGIVAGALYSTLLLTLYVPVLTVHDAWSARLAERAISANPKMELSAWRESQALNRSALATLGQIGAVIGPWLAAIGLPKLLAGA